MKPFILFTLLFFTSFSCLKRVNVGKKFPAVVGRYQWLYSKSFDTLPDYNFDNTQERYEVEIKKNGKFVMIRDGSYESPFRITEAKETANGYALDLNDRHHGNVGKFEVDITGDSLTWFGNPYKDYHNYFVRIQ